MIRRGFTVLESLVCNLLVACITLAAFGLFVGSSQALHLASQRSQAGDLAHREIEIRRSLGFAQLLPGRVSLPAQTIEGVRYTGECEVAVHPDFPTDLKTVRVRIEWTVHNRPHQVVRESWLSALRN